MSDEVKPMQFRYAQRQPTVIEDLRAPTRIAELERKVAFLYDREMERDRRIGQATADAARLREFFQSRK